MSIEMDNLPTTDATGATITVLEIVQTEKSNIYYIRSSKNFEITEIQTKATRITYVEDNYYSLNESYTFYTSISEKTYEENIEKYQYKITVSMVDSPKVICGQNKLTIRFIIKLYKNNYEFEIVADTTRPNSFINKGDQLYYTSNDYTNRQHYPYSLNLDSIYRPFFFNTILLFEGANTPSSGNTENPSNAKLYFSIANGITYRKNKNENKYYIGDIKLNILGENNYEFKIKDHFRTFSEMDDVYKNGNIDGRHVFGIRESGSKDERGVVLPKNDYKNDVYVSQTVDEHGNVKNIKYYFDEIKSDEIINYGFQNFIADKPFDIIFSVDDSAPEGENYNTIQRICDNVLFPKITIAYPLFLISKESYRNNISYLAITEEEKGSRKILNSVLDILGNINVNDNEILNNDSIFPSFFKKMDELYGNNGSTRQVIFSYASEIECYLPTKPLHTYYPDYILAIYHDGYEKNEEDISFNQYAIENGGEKKRIFSHVKHTNKLLIMKLYEINWP